MSTRLKLGYDPFEVLEERAKNTPDWDELKKSVCDEFPILITGQMRRHRYRNKLLNGCNYYGIGVTWGQNFIMKHSNINAGPHEPEPNVFHFDSDKTDWKEIGHYFNPNEQKHVEGDIYGVPLSLLARLDNEEGNTEGITRKKIYVSMMSPIQQDRGLRCFMYTVDTDYFMECFSPHADLDFCPTVTYPRTPLKKQMECYRV